MHQGKITNQILQKYVFLAAVVTAPFDELLAWEIGPFTIRLAQILLLVGGLLLLWSVLRDRSIKIPAGGFLLLAMLAINFILCFTPTNENRLALFGYEAWFGLNVVFVFLAANCYESRTDQKLFGMAFAFPFFFSATVCFVQVAISFWDVTFFTDQFFGELNRADAFLSEPSYYACFALPMWVTVSYWIENAKEPVSTRTRLFWTLITASIVLSTSRMGNLMMGAWIIFRILVCLATPAKRKNLKKIACLLIAILTMLALYAALYSIAIGCGYSNADIQPSREQISEERSPQKQPTQGNVVHPSFADRMLDIAGSDVPRITGMLSTLDTFVQKHLLIGASLGGVYSSVAELHPEMVQVVNLFSELLAAFGIPGFVLLLLWIFKISRTAFYQKTNQYVLALWWGIIWQIGILQFNNNGLRVYLWANIAMLCALLPKSEIRWSKENGFSYHSGIQCDCLSGSLH